MATSTTRLGLRKPDPDPTTGDDVDVSLDISASMDKIDAAVGCTVCTSGTRPGSPWQGQLIFETDTGKVQVWNGSAWKHVISINTGSAIAWAGNTTITGDLAITGVFTDGTARVSRNVYTANDTWTKPTGLRAAHYQVQASGGAGGGAITGASGAASMGAGGGAGGYAEGLIAASSLAATVAITVGAGASGISGAAGNNGNTSSFGAHGVAAGGIGGGARATSTVNFGIAGSLGGTVSAGEVQVPGQPGDSGWGTAHLGISGNGAMSRFGAGGRGLATSSQPSSTAGNSGSGRGSGGGGAIVAGTGASVAGGASPSGIVIVTNFF